MARGAWRATVHEIINSQSDITKHTHTLSHTHTHTYYQKRPGYKMLNDLPLLTIYVSILKKVYLLSIPQSILSPHFLQEKNEHNHKD